MTTDQPGREWAWHQYSDLRLNTARADLLRWLSKLKPEGTVNLFNPQTSEDGPDSDLYIEAGVLRALLYEEPSDE